jgi:hypothetical protein
MREKKIKAYERMGERDGRREGGRGTLGTTSMES